MASSETRQLSIAALALLVAAAAAATEVYRVVLRVNDRIATSYDYEQRKAQRLEAIRQAEELSVEERQDLLARVGEEVMSELFEELLLLSRADQLDVEVTESGIDSAVSQARESFGVSNDEQFKVLLDRWGISGDQFREQMRRNLMIREVMGREVQGRIAVVEEDLRRYYQGHPEEFQVPERLRLSEVVVLESSGLEAEAAMNLAEEVRGELVAGRALEEVVAEAAEAGLTTSVIDLGWVETGDLDADLEAAVWKLGVGETSEPVSGRGGIHLLQVEEREEARLLPFSEVAPAIEARERDRRFREEVQGYMAELEVQSYVVADPPPEAAGFRDLLTQTSADLSGLGGLLGTAAPEAGEGEAEQPAAEEPPPSP